MATEQDSPCRRTGIANGVPADENQLVFTQNICLLILTSLYENAGATVLRLKIRGCMEKSGGRNSLVASLFQNRTGDFVGQVSKIAGLETCPTNCISWPRFRSHP